MRTTLNLDDDILAVAKQLAGFEHRSLGSVVSELARRGLSPRTGSPGNKSAAFPTFEVPAGAPTITDDAVARALDEA